MARTIRIRSEKSARRGEPGAWRFLRTFILGWLTLTLLPLMIPPIPPFSRALTAWSLGLCLRALGIPALVDGEVVTFAPAGAFRIITECTALYIAPIFAGAVLAAPVDWRQKVGALGWGIPLVLLFNLLRLIGLALIMIHWPTAFEFFHEYLWQVLFGATVIVVWWVWCERALRRRAVAQPQAH